MSYEQQLETKRNVLARAYSNFSGLGAGDVPEVQPTLPSPLQYGYRTKLTPHFQAPPKNKPESWECTIGFESKGRRRILDIEECPIATSTINDALPAARENVKRCVASSSGHAMRAD